MDNLKKVVVKALDAALGRETDPTQKIYAAIIGTEPVISAAEKKQLAQLQREYETSYHGAAVLFAHEAAKDAYHKHLAEHGKLSRSGTLGDVRTRDWPSIQAEFQSKQNACKSEMYKIAAEAGVIAVPILERFILAAEKFVATREASERTEAEAFGLQVQPTALTTAGKQLLATQKNRLAAGVNHAAPKEQIPFI